MSLKKTHHVVQTKYIQFLFVNHTSVKLKKKINSIKRLAKDQNRHFSKVDTQIANKHMKKIF